VTVAAIYSGIGVALVTLFDEHGELDAAATAGLAGELVERGVDAVIVSGSTGEAHALDPEERVELLGAVRGVVDGAVPVIAGTGAPSARQAVRRSRAAIDAGADGLLVLSPFLTPDPRSYYETVAEASGGTPVLAYHVPQVSPPGIPVEMLPDLPVVGVKDSSGDPKRLLATRGSVAADVLVGSSALLLMAGAVGCEGAILAIANLEPELCAAAFAGGADEQMDVFRRSQEHGSLRQLKRALAERHGTSEVVRAG
jgi:4-hydroxy-tetrahydrodipicolinate synthase